MIDYQLDSKRTIEFGFKISGFYRTLNRANFIVEQNGFAYQIPVQLTEDKIVLDFPDNLIENIEPGICEGRIELVVDGKVVDALKTQIDFKAPVVVESTVEDVREEPISVEVTITEQENPWAIFSQPLLEEFGKAMKRGFEVEPIERNGSVIAACFAKNGEYFGIALPGDKSISWLAEGQLSLEQLIESVTANG